MAATSESGSALPTGQELREAKRAMRERILAARDRLPVGTRDAAASAIAERVIALASFRNASTVLLTMPFKSEWNMRPVLDAALTVGKTAMLPRVDRKARMLVLHAVHDPDRDVEPGYFGIPEPRLHCTVIQPEQVDWILVPGVAFDFEGRRLGYGGGFYDRLLPLLAPRAVRVAGIFDLQIVDRVPAASHDLAVDTIVTENRTLVPVRDDRDG